MISLATINPNHRYFAKDYVPSVKESRNTFGKAADQSDSDEELEIHDDFFDDLPADILKATQRRASCLRVAKR